MEDVWVLGVLGPAGAVLMFILLAGWGIFEAGRYAEREEWRAELVERGLAEHCPSDGRWAWMDECNRDLGVAR